MTSYAFIWSNVRYHFRSHLGTLCGTAIAAAVLVGALVVGDSVRQSLRRLAQTRLGGVEHALSSQDRLFTMNLARALEAEAGGRVAPALHLPGTATRPDGSARANRVQVFGVDDRFWQFSPGPAGVGGLSGDRAALNQRLALQLGVQAGDEILVRVPKPTQLSRDAPLAPEEDSSVALRLQVVAILGDAQFGRFGLQASQVAPFNLYLSIATLQARTAVGERANLLLAGGQGASVTAENLDAAIAKVWSPADAQLEFRPVSGAHAVELRTARVFLDPPVEAAASQVQPGATRILTYFVNEIRAGERATPYSMVTAAEAPLVPADLAEDEILIQPWLAEDLGVGPGAALELKYYVVGLGRALEERSARFRVRAILPARSPLDDPTLMPDFPGLTDAENCRDWDTGFPIDTSRIREKDEKYWDDYRGTPKAFVALAAGRKIWGNRFGELTALRFAQGQQTEAVAAGILGRLAPAAVSLRFEPVKQLAAASVAQAQDFGGLFLGFSLFLIAAALILMGLLFQFSLDRRAVEIGTLLAMGFTARRVRALLLGEAVVIAALGSLLGTAGGLYYARAMLLGLTTAWKDAVGTSALEFAALPPTLGGGFAAGLIIAFGTVWLGLRRQARQPAQQLLAGGGLETTAPAATQASPQFSWRLALLAGTGAIVMVALSFARSGEPNPGLFFGAGALLLIAGIAACAAGLTWLTRASGALAADAGMTRLTELMLRNCARRPRRSLATVGLIASGTFLVASIGVFRLDSERDAGSRTSGTGGFALIGETSLPVVQDLNTQAGRDAFGLREADLDGVSFVPLRVREGEDASCLNLNRAQRPRLLGVRTGGLVERGGFSFVQTFGQPAPGSPWQLLTQPLPGGAIPAIGDNASILWAMGKKVGDVLVFVDERGSEFRVRIVGAVANSILQGNLLIDESHFVQRYPSESGYRMFLIDAPSNRVDAVSQALSRGLRDAGLELTPSSRRLGEFNAVQNTYLGTFQVLGGLGLILGSMGLGVLVLRNVLERRSELALLLALGFAPARVRKFVAGEHAALLVCGLGIGIDAAAVAVLPALFAAGTEVPFGSLGATLAGILVSGMIWTWAAARFALRGPLLDSLRTE